MSVTGSNNDLTVVGRDNDMNATVEGQEDFENTLVERPLTRSRIGLGGILGPPLGNVTRNRVSRRGRVAPANEAGDMGEFPVEPGNSVDEDSIRLLISNSLDNFRCEISSEIENLLRNIDLNPRVQQSQDPETRHLNQDIEPMEMRTHGTHNPLVNRGLGRVNENSDKVLNIIRNWRLKFSGRSDEMDVDEFIYRVNILTSNTLNGDYELLCNHAYSIFEGKALDWFWKYHQRNNQISWISLTNALRRQYKSDYSDFDIRDDIRRRKQKSNETFDEYLDSVVAIMDKLKTPMTDEELCETVLRNLKPEIRLELLHIEIKQISQLRREVRKHEKFMTDMRTNTGYRNSYSKRQIAELDCDSQIQDDEPEEDLVDICAINKTIICWNCEETGHTYKDCIKAKKVFCYGCGLKDTYKPNCIKCKISGNSKKDALQQRKGHPNTLRKN